MGDSPWSIAPAKEASNPVMTWEDVSDVPALSVADPFMIKVKDTHYMFFEVVNLTPWKGEIGLATSNNGIDWSYQAIVLAEPFHLSYPYVFGWQNEFYMIPESARGGGVYLYKATTFPNRWTRVGSMLKGSRFVDNSIFSYEDIWYLFTEAGPSAQQPVLRLYYASELTGPWSEHPASPIVEGNPHIARPGGRVLVIDNRVFRFTQDVWPEYGTKVRAFEIFKLSPTTYEEHEVGERPVLVAGNETWNSGGMHHIDAHRLKNGTWLACVDGRTSLSFPRNAK